MKTGKFLTKAKKFFAKFDVFRLKHFMLDFFSHKKHKMLKIDSALFELFVPLCG